MGNPVWALAGVRRLCWQGTPVLEWSGRDFSVPLEHRGALPVESPDTHRGSHRIPQGILRPLVSGTQHLPQSNRAEPETAVNREADYPGLLLFDFEDLPEIFVRLIYSCMSDSTGHLQSLM